jgi:filamentous hemagglutinin family protein
MLIQLRRCLGLSAFSAPRALLAGIWFGMGAGYSTLAWSDLPVAAESFVQSGEASYAADAATRSALVQQNSDRAVLNWKSFNIGSDHSVRFQQPSASSVAINKIYQIDPSRINGALSANGKIYLINPNGIIFGEGARVNANALVTSSLGVRDDLLESSGLLEAIEEGAAVFEAGVGLEAFQEIAGQELPDNMGVIAVAPGAQLTSGANGFVLLIGSAVLNEGEIDTPDGQAILAASNSKVYLAKPGDAEDARLIGMLVEVDLEDVPQSVRDAFEAQNGIRIGQVKNAGSGVIEAERGNVTLMGMAVNQEGRIRATTAVNVGGSIRLVARETAGSLESLNKRTVAMPAQYGEVVIGEDSVTEVLVDLGDRETTVDANEQLPSRVEVIGKRIEVGDRAQIIAKGGEIEMIATTLFENPNLTLPNRYSTNDLPGQYLEQGDPEAELIIGEDVVLDVSGTDLSDWVAWIEAHPEDADLDNPLIFEMARNLAEMKVLGFELRDSPLQRDEELNPDKVLDGIDMVFDRRNAPEIADVEAALAALERTVAERTTTGGTISIKSAGHLETGRGTQFDVRGGSVQYTDGYINTTMLEADGRLYDISEAPKDIIYDRVVDAAEYGEQLASNFERGYLEGKDSGSVELYGNSLDSVLFGHILGEVTRGVNQRQPASSVGGFNRAYTEVPQAATVILGRTRELFARGDGTRIDLSPDAAFSSSLTIEGMQQLDLTVGERFQVPAGEQLALAAGGEYSVTAPVVEIRGDIQAPASKLKFRAKNPLDPNSDNRIEVGTGVEVDVSGLWVNDTAFSGFLLDPLYTSAGSIDLLSEGDLLLDSDSLLRANAGGWVDRNGDFAAGGAGDISVGVKFDLSRKQLELYGGFEAYGFGGGKGSSLSLIGPGFLVEAGSEAVVGRLEGGTNRVILGEGFFSSGGFSEFALTSTHDGIDIADGARVDLDPMVMRPLEPVAITHGSRHLAETVPLVAGGSRWSPATRLRLTHRLNNYSSPTAVVRIGENAEIVTTTTRTSDLSDCWSGASDCSGILLDSDTSILVQGALRSPGGSIVLQTVKNQVSEALDRFHPEQGIWIGETAQLDVSGAARTYQVDNLIHGNLYGGGEIALRADRGFVVAAPGSLLRLRGASVEIDLPGGSPLAAQLREGSYEHAAGGTLSLESPEGIYFFSDLEAGVLDGNPYAGGSFRLSLNAGSRSNINGTEGFPEVPLEIRLGDHEWNALGINGLLQPVSAGYQGVALLNPNQLTSSGIDALELSARSHKNLDQQLLGASLLFQGDVDLEFNRRVVLDLQAIASDGGLVSISSPYVSLGADNTQYRLDEMAFPEATAGDGRLAVEAALLDLVGDLAFQGFGGQGSGGDAPIHLYASEDIRLRGSRVEAYSSTNVAINREVTGQLVAGTSLTLDAGKAIYTTTLSEFELTLDAGTLTFTGGVRGVMPTRLSAGGSLLVEADHIVQEGTLLVPFGTLELNGRESLTLASGSITSVSGAGLEVPFGTIGIEDAWLYDFGLDTKVLEAPPEKRIALAATDEDIQEGAIIDISGGGKLTASRFIFGPGGSSDILSNAESNGAFAIVPALGGAYAPYDPALSSGFEYAIGTLFQVTGAQETGIADGWYVVMPARYALLPGGYLITPTASNATGLVPGQAYQGEDGVSVVTGRFGIQGTAQQEHAWSTFRVENSDQFLKRAEYLVADADSYFSSRAADNDTIVPELPRDAGALLLAPGDSLVLEGRLIAESAQGRAPRVDITGSNIAILDHLDASTDLAGRIELLSSALQNFGADSLLIGGTRRMEGDQTYIDVVSEHVLVEDNDGGGLLLELPELLLTASGTIDIDAGVTLAGVSNGFSQTDTQTLIHDSADEQQDVTLLAVSGRTLSGFEGFSVGGSRSSTLTLAAGSTLSAPGSMALLAGGQVDLQGELSALENSSLFFGSDRIAVGAEAQGAGDVALVLDTNRLATLEGKRIAFRAGSFEVHGAAELSATSLLLDAAGILGIGGAGEGASFEVDGTLTLTNSSNSSLGLATSSMDSLEISAGEVALAGGRFQIEGFSAVVIDSGAFIGRAGDEGSSGLAVSGDLTLGTDVVGAEQGVELDIAATGALELIQSETLDASSSWSTLGGRIGMSGSSVGLNTRVVLPSGHLTLSANGAAGDVTLGDRAEILLQGIEVYFDTVAVGTSGGYLEISSAQGGVLFDDPTINLSGAGSEGHGGEILIEARNGEFSVGSGSQILTAAAEGRDQGGFTLDAGTLLGGLSGLNAVLGQEFGASRSIRVRTGDLNLGANETFAAQEIKLVAESGTVSIDGLLDARGPQAGRVELIGGSGVTLSTTGQILATSTQTGEEGGEVLLEVADGLLRLDGFVDVSGTGTQESGGRVRLVAPRGTNDALAALDSLGGTIVGAERIELIGMRSYRTTSAGRVGTLQRDSGSGTWGLGTVQGHNADFMAGGNLNVIADRLGIGAFGAGSQYHFMPGVEIASDGDLSVDQDLDLYTWREGGEPGLLRLRAAGDLRLGRGSQATIIGDGFDRSSGDALGGSLEQGRLGNSESWTLELVGGSDLGSVDRAATLGSGGVTVLDNTDVRTGTGDILVAAAGDIQLQGTESKIYTAGIDAGGGAFLEAEGRGAEESSYDSLYLTLYMYGVAFARDGGDVRIEAGGDIVGVEDTQIANHWLLKLGRDIDDVIAFFDDPGNDPEQAFASEPGLVSTAWGIAFDRFAQGIGALGGGDVALKAGGDILDVSVSIPTSGRQVGELGLTSSYSAYFTPQTQENRVEILGGGDLQVQAGGDIVGGNYYVQQGEALIRAGGNVGTDNDTLDQDGIMLSLGDVAVEIEAGGGVSVDNVHNPSMVAQVSNQMHSWMGTWDEANNTRFLSFGEGTALTLAALNGEIRLAEGSSRILNLDYITDAAEDITNSLYPARLGAVAFSGSILIEGQINLVSAEDGNLRLLADDSIYGSRFSSEVILQSDIDPQAMPTWASPQAGLATLNASFNSNNQGHAATSPYANNSLANEVIAANGDIRDLSLFLAKQSRLIAGQDILNIEADIQHSMDSALGGDFTLIQAGRDIRFTFARNPRGKISVKNNPDRGFVISGDGSVQVIAGRDVDLGDSRGLLTIGNRTEIGEGGRKGQVGNENLPESGADINILAGLSAQADYDAFIQQYLMDEENQPVRRILALELPEGELSKEDITELKGLFEGESEYWVVGSYMVGNAIALELERKPGLGVEEELAPALLADIAAFADSRQGTYVVSPSYDYRTLAWDYVARKLDDPSITVEQAVAYLAAAPDQRENLDFLLDIFFSELVAGGQRAALEGSRDYFSRSKLAISTLFPTAPTADSPLLEMDSASGLPTQESVAAVMAQSLFQGDVRSLFSRISPEDGGSVRLAIPGGDYIGGTVDLLTYETVEGEKPVPTGLVVPKEGNLLLMAANNVTVNSSKIINRSSGGDMVIWSSIGNIDAGRGQRGARVETSPFDISATDGSRKPNDTPVVSGSGIQNLPAAGGIIGNTYLLTELGVIDAGTAGIQAENITLVAALVQNAQALELGSVTSNLSIGGDAGPMSTPDLGSVDSQVADGALGDPTDDLAESGAGDEEMLAMLSVEVVGMGLNSLPPTGAGIEDEDCGPPGDPRRNSERCRQLEVQ